MNTWIGIALAGALGAVSRYAISAGVGKHLPVVNLLGVPWPLPILLVNMLGCLLAGGLLALMETRWQLSPTLSSILIIGFLGAFTTFSAFAVETLQLLKTHGLVIAIVNVLMHNLLTIGCVLLGYYALR